jgi:hypothetical protein
MGHYGSFGNKNRAYPGAIKAVNKRHNTVKDQFVGVQDIFVR